MSKYPHFIAYVVIMCHILEEMLIDHTDAGETIEFKFLGFKCDHEDVEQLEPKNYSKSAKIH